MTDDPRCCGSDTCIIDPEGRCWCGQQWDGRAMSPAAFAPSAPTAASEPSPASGTDDKALLARAL